MTTHQQWEASHPGESCGVESCDEDHPRHAAPDPAPLDVERLANALSEGDPDTQYDYGDFANLTTGHEYAARILAAVKENNDVP